MKHLWFPVYLLLLVLPACETGTEEDGDFDMGDDPTDMGVQGPAHEDLLDKLIGFGQPTTGGAGGPVVSVTTLDDSGPGSLREAATAPGAAWIRFEVSGVIELQNNILVASDKTLDGRGADVTIVGGGLYVQGGEGNVIVNNLKLRDTPDDILRFFDGGSRMWVHHCDLSSGGDGAFDATEGVSQSNRKFKVLSPSIPTSLPNRATTPSSRKAWPTPTRSLPRGQGGLSARASGCSGVRGRFSASPGDYRVRASLASARA